MQRVRSEMRLRREVDSRTPSWSACVFILPYLYMVIRGYISHN